MRIKPGACPCSAILPTIPLCGLHACVCVHVPVCMRAGNGVHTLVHINETLCQKQGGYLLGCVAQGLPLASTFSSNSWLKSFGLNRSKSKFFAYLPCQNSFQS
ncbi:mCG147249 [Mus musculus]|nr:mCG147249 [Mus musculus]